MKSHYLAFTLLSLSLMACKNTSQLNVAVNPSSTNQLTQYQWTYQNAKASKPLALWFNPQQQLSVQTGCNTQNGTWRIDSDKLVISALTSTMMACSDELMQQEKFATELLQNRQLAFSINTSQPAQATLVLSDTQGKTYTFVGRMTAETKYQSQAQTIFLEISPQTKTCTGVASQQCMQVREVKYDDNGIKNYVDKNWTLYYGHIEGFVHDPSQRVIVRVKRYELKNPAADQSTQADVLDMVVEQEVLKNP